MGVCSQKDRKISLCPQQQDTRHLLREPHLCGSPALMLSLKPVPHHRSNHQTTDSRSGRERIHQNHQHKTCQGQHLGNYNTENSKFLYKQMVTKGIIKWKKKRNYSKLRDLEDTATKCNVWTCWTHIWKKTTVKRHFETMRKKWTQSGH